MASSVPNMEQIPARFLCHSVQILLANKLDPDHAVNGQDWRMLAEKLLDYTTEDMYVIKEHKQRNTLLVFDEYMKIQGSTVNEIERVLRSMERGDALNILLGAMPEIKASYQKDFNKQKNRQAIRQPMEHEHQWSNPNFGGHSCCGGHNSRMPQPPPSPHSPECMSHLPHSSYGHYPGSCSYQPAPGSLCHSASFPSQDHYARNVRYPVRDEYSRYHCSEDANNHVPCDMVSINSPNVNHSMVVHADVSPLSQQFPSHENDIEMAEMDSNPEEAVSLTQAIFRAQKKVMNIHTAAHMEDVLTSASEEFSSGDSDLGQFAEGKKYFRQISNECNMSQTSMNEQPRNGFVGKKKINGVRHRATTSSQPLGNLINFSKSPETYMPSNDYTKIIADQKVDDLVKKTVKREKDKSVKCQSQAVDCTKVRNKLKNVYGTAPNTFPIRMKSQNTGTTIADLQHQHEQSNSLTKSVSLPNDMKPEEFKKTFRHINIFVTYAYEDKMHLQHVLTMCKCLMKNGFSCNVDVQGRKMENCVQTVTDEAWYRQKIAVADFVLVCVSNKYKSEVDGCDPSSRIHSHRLHTRYIYQLMLSEYKKTSNNMRYIPIIMEKMSKDMVPSWMPQSLIYHWPAMFKDLFWMLTKPHERIKQKQKS